LTLQVFPFARRSLVFSLLPPKVSSRTPRFSMIFFPNNRIRPLTLSDGTFSGYPAFSTRPLRLSLVYASHPLHLVVTDFACWTTFRVSFPRTIIDFPRVFFCFCLVPLSNDVCRPFVDCKNFFFSLAVACFPTVAPSHPYPFLFIPFFRHLYAGEPKPFGPPRCHGRRRHRELSLV